VPFLLESRELAADAMTYGCNKRRHDAAVEARGISRALVTRQHRPGLMLATVLSFVPPTACTTELPTPCPFHAPPTKTCCALCTLLQVVTAVQHPHAAFVKLQPCSHIAFVDREPNLHIVFVIAQAHPPIALAAPRPPLCLWGSPPSSPTLPLFVRTGWQVS
jgi:hypothetical protein